VWGQRGPRRSSSLVRLCRSGYGRAVELAQSGRSSGPQGSRGFHAPGASSVDRPLAFWRVALERPQRSALPVGAAQKGASGLQKQSILGVVSGKPSAPKNHCFCGQQGRTRKPGLLLVGVVLSAPAWCPHCCVMTPRRMLVGVLPPLGQADDRQKQASVCVGAAPVKPDHPS
jgi:hypothetical protein